MIEAIACGASGRMESWRSFRNIVRIIPQGLVTLNDMNELLKH